MPRVAKCEPASRRRSLPRTCAPVWCRGSGSDGPLLADENLNRKIVVGLQRRIDDLDLVRVQDVGLQGLVPSPGRAR